MTKKQRYTTKRAFQELGQIDKAHESGRITKRMHDVKSMRVLRKLTAKKR